MSLNDSMDQEKPHITATAAEHAVVHDVAERGHIATDQ